MESILSVKINMNIVNTLSEFDVFMGYVLYQRKRWLKTKRQLGPNSYLCHELVNYSSIDSSKNQMNYNSDT